MKLGADRCVPLYRQLEEILARRILSGTIKPGGRVPSEHNLMDEYSVSRSTACRALVELERRGLVYRVRGAGTFVAGACPNDVLSHRRTSGSGEPRVVFVQKRYDKSSMYNPFFVQALAGAEGRCAELGYRLVFETVRCDGDVFRRGTATGYILVNVEDKELVRRFQHSGHPVVILNTYFPDLDIPYVTFDNLKGGYLATQHLIELGHRRIGIVAVSGGHMPFNDRLKGFEMALEHGGISLIPEFIVKAGSGEREAYEAASKLLSHPSPPTAVFAMTDIMALGVMEAAREKGVDIPGDLSLVGYDDQSFARHLDPPLTTICQNGVALGEKAVDLLWALIQGRPVDLHKFELAPKLVVRKSTRDLREGGMD